MLTAIKSFLFRNVAVSAGISLVTSVLMSAWRRNEPAIERSFPAAVDWFEARTGLNIPDDQEKIAVSWWVKLVQAVNKGATSKSFIRMLIKYLMDTNNSAQKTDLIDEASKLGMYDLLTENFSPALRVEVNAVKSLHANRIARAILPDSVPSRLINDKIKRACKINSPILHSGEEVNNELLTKLIAESKARQEAMK